MAAAPTVSIIVPAYNAVATVRECLASLTRQTFSDWEAWVIDDGSTDDTLVVLRDIALTERRLEVLVQQNQRQAVARNSGLAKARGRYIAFLDADDLALPDRLSKQVSFLEKHPEVTVLGGGRIDVDAATGNERGTFLPPEDHETLCSRIFTECPFSTSTVMARSSFFERRQFDPLMPPCEDHDLWLRSYRDSGIRYHNLPEPLVRYSCKRHVPWSHYRQMGRMYRRALKEEGRWPRQAWRKSS